MKNEKKNKTGWGNVARWYDESLKEEGTYQKELIFPNIVRLLGEIKGKSILDLACGSGFFAREFARLGAKVTAVDISTELIALAKKQGDPSPPVGGSGRLSGVVYHVSPAHRLPFLKDKTVDVVVMILAVQNIENVSEVFKECARVLKPGGRMLVAMNHPAFRIPKHSEWGWDPSIGSGHRGTQYRRIDSYLSEMKIPIEMHPGEKTGGTTISFHRPLQFYFKAFQKAGFAVTRLEEWNSYKQSAPGPRADAENKARKEIPLFLCVEAQQI